MALEIIGMYGAATGGTNDALAQIDVPQDGLLVGIDWDASWNIDADAEFAGAELSFIATNQLVTNDSRGRISSIATAMSLTTSGVAVAQVQKFINVMNLVLHGGERLFLHALGSVGASGDIRCNLHFFGGTTTPRRSARR